MAHIRGREPIPANGYLQLNFNMDYRNNIEVNGSQGLRNNNPGNFRVGINWDGAIGENNGFIVFSDTIYGIRAMALNLYNNYYLYNKKTLFDFINKYAPSSDNNNPYEYSLSVARDVGIGINDDMQLTFDRTAAILRGMMNIELGKYYSSLISDEDIKQGISLINKWQISLIKSEAVIKNNWVLILTSSAAISLSLYLYFRINKTT